MSNLFYQINLNAHTIHTYIFLDCRLIMNFILLYGALLVDLLKMQFKIWAEFTDV